MISEKSFDSILLKFLLTEPFFATIVRKMRKVRTEEIPTAGVSYQDGAMILYWNSNFLESLEPKKIFGLLKHECYHLIFKHVTDRKQKPFIHWNIATDLAINSIIPESELPECGLIPGKKNEMPTVEGVKIDKNRKELIEKFSAFIESLPSEKSSEWYMEKILENKEICQTIEELYTSKVLVVMDEHDNSDLSEAEKAMADQKLKEILKDAKEIADKRGWGSVSYSVRSEVEKATQSQFDWERALKYFCGSKMRNNYFKTQRKLNRKYPYIHPGRKAKKTSSLAVYIDQSGSVGADSLSRFGAVLEQLSKTHTFTFYFFDAAVEEESRTTWKKGRSVNFGRSLSGGTCFNAVEDHFRKIKKDYDGYVVMTDGYASKPNSCTSKRCWVICPSGQLQFTPDRKDFVIKMNKEF